MNLYKIIFSHHSPKDSEYGIKALLLADNDEEVYEWISSEQDFNVCWKEKENDCEVFNIYDDEYEVIGEENFKEKIVRLNGEINDESVDFSDSYYGITLYGWELLKKDVLTDYSELIELGIVFKTKN
jgi:hypothetical protein